MARNINPYPHCRWTLEAVTEEKARAAKELDQVASKPNWDGRLKFSLEKVAELENDLSPRGQLRRFIFAVSALVAHARTTHRGLTLSQITRLERLALAILKVQGVRPQSSRLTSLYSQLDLVMSQIHRKEGNHWASLWIQQISAHFPGVAELSASDWLALGVRTQRTGHTRLALQAYSSAIENGISGPSLYRAHWGKIATYRLRGELDAARMVIEETWRLNLLSRDEKLELKWQELCIEAQASGRITPLVSAVLRGGKLCRADYRIEATLWAYGVASMESFKRLPALQNLGRSFNVSLGRDRLYQTALKMESFYDSQIPLFLRARALGKVIERTSRLVHADHELLTLAAAARWLARHDLDLMARIVYQSYENHCRMLSGNQFSDVLNLLGDFSSQVSRKAA